MSEIADIDKEDHVSTSKEHTSPTTAALISMIAIGIRHVKIWDNLSHEKEFLEQINCSFVAIFRMLTHTCGIDIYMLGESHV